MWPFGRKKPTGGPQRVGTSPGGSAMIRYGGHEFDKPQFGVLDEETVEWAKRREAVYEGFFGPCEQVFHEILPLVPHIDVYQFKPGYKDRDFWTLVTSGISDLPTSLPGSVSKDRARIDLVFYCDEPEERYLNMLRALAHFPHDNKTWLGLGHTMPNGNPPLPIFENTPNLDSFLFLPTFVKPDKWLGRQLQIEGCPVVLLWVVPITSKECALKLDKGMGAICDLFDSVEHPFVFRGDRKSYV